MKGLSTHISKAVTIGSVLTCADNSGAKTVMMIGRIGKSGKRGKLVSAGIGDIIMASVKTGDVKYVKKIVRSVIIRQKQPIRRLNGLRVKFEDNAVILLSDTNLPIGTEVKGAMAREVIERNLKLAGIASRVI
ncbi:MAG: uL14 family ribosomal protein [Candidatus Micrarchaeaceae archaeon]|nr:uL14 family ribosomal protein [Candidatus Marsarchaeota archaeon]